MVSLGICRVVGNIWRFGAGEMISRPVRDAKLASP